MIDLGRSILYRTFPDDNELISKSTIADNNFVFWHELIVAWGYAFSSSLANEKNVFTQMSTYSITFTIFAYHGFNYIDRIARGMDAEEDWLYGKLLCMAEGRASKSSIEAFFDYVDYDGNYLKLLEDRLIISELRHDNFSMENFIFEHANPVANKQKVIKEFINSLEPLNQKLVEFCTFYVPYNLDEKKLGDFLNKQNEYSNPQFGIDKLNLQKALTGQNMELLKELQQFFIEENGIA